MRLRDYRPREGGLQAVTSRSDSRNARPARTPRLRSWSGFDPRSRDLSGRTAPRRRHPCWQPQARPALLHVGCSTRRRSVVEKLKATYVTGSDQWWYEGVPRGCADVRGGANGGGQGVWVRARHTWTCGRRRLLRRGVSATCGSSTPQPTPGSKSLIDTALHVTATALAVLNSQPCAPGCWQANSCTRRSCYPPPPSRPNARGLG